MPFFYASLTSRGGALLSYLSGLVTFCQLSEEPLASACCLTTPLECFPSLEGSEVCSWAWEVLLAEVFFRSVKVPSANWKRSIEFVV